MSRLILCGCCEKKNRALQGLAVYVPLKQYSERGRKTTVVRDLWSRGLTHAAIARKARISLRQVYRILAASNV